MPALWATAVMVTGGVLPTRLQPLPFVLVLVCEITFKQAAPLYITPLHGGALCQCTCTQHTVTQCCVAVTESNKN